MTHFLYLSIPADIFSEAILVRIILHAGAQCTDDEHHMTTLIRNKEVLTNAKVTVPHPKSYRIPLRKILNQMLRKGQI